MIGEEVGQWQRSTVEERERYIVRVRQDRISRFQGLGGNWDDAGKGSSGTNRGLAVLRRTALYPRRLSSSGKEEASFYS
jgi:hypothetical protein